MEERGDAPAGARAPACGPAWEGRTGMGSDGLWLGANSGGGRKSGLRYWRVGGGVGSEEGRRIAWQSGPRSPLGSRLAGGRIWRYELEPVGQGTLVRESWD